ncbi:hypothetical protein MTO96_048857 [Rhipicephalus appendiculatus]
MAVDVVAELLIHIDRLTAQDLQCLAAVRGVDLFSSLRTMQPEGAKQEIHRLLDESSSESLFLERVGWLYCWLVSRQKIGPWYLIRFGASARQVDSKTLLTNVGTVMRSIDCDTFSCVSQQRGTHYGCMIRNCSDDTAETWTLVLVVLWSGQRFAAAYVGTNEQQRNLMDCLHVALRGESVEMLPGLHEDLNAAFRAGMPLPGHRRSNVTSTG